MTVVSEAPSEMAAVVLEPDEGLPSQKGSPPHISRLGDERLLRDLITRLVCERVQEAVDNGEKPQEGGRRALESLVARGWDKTWMRLFGPSALASQWQSLIVDQERRRFYASLEGVAEAPIVPSVEAEERTTVEVMLPGQPLPSAPRAVTPPFEEAVVESAGLFVLPDSRVPAPPQAVEPSRHGRESAVSILSRDIELLLATNLRVAGIPTTAGELRKADVLTIMAETRERASAYLAGYKRRAASLKRLSTYFEDDATYLRTLISVGRINATELRVFVDAIR